MPIKYSFFIKVKIDGKQTPFIWVDNPYSALSALSSGCLSKYEGVQMELNRLYKVVSGKKESYTFAGSSCCIIDAKRHFSLVSNGFEEFEPYTIPTAQLLALLEGWLDFLWHYENGQIPGLVPEAELNS